MMYDMNQHGTTPRDRLDPRLFEQPAAAATSMQDTVSACGCGDGGAARGSTAPRMDSCGSSCTPDADMQMPALAMVYSPRQSWQRIYCAEDALLRGTIFEELDKPFYGPACMGGGCNG